MASAVGAAGVPAAAPSLTVPVHRVTDRRAQCTPQQFRHFWWSIWPEAVRDFGRCGMRLECSDATGEIRRSPAGRPLFLGLERGVINLMLTDHIPMDWDNGRALAGVTKLHEGYCLCVVALRYAHGHRIPFFSTNTCVHEMLHVLLQDIFLRRPGAIQVGEHETRIDWYATRMWLFHEGGAVRQSAAISLSRLRTSAATCCR